MATKGSLILVGFDVGLIKLPVTEKFQVIHAIMLPTMQDQLMHYTCPLSHQLSSPPPPTKNILTPCITYDALPFKILTTFGYMGGDFFFAYNTLCMSMGYTIVNKLIQVCTLRISR